MQDWEFTSRVYDSAIKGDGVSERPPVTWANRMEEYWGEKNRGRIHGMVYAKEACKERDKWRLFAMVTP